MCLGLFICLGLSYGCAFDLAHVKYRSVYLNAIESDKVPFTLTADTPVKGAPCGFSRTLRKGTRWDPAGILVEGVVYRSSDQTLTIECSNVFEVYLVIEGQHIVGFYLPVEKGFSPLDKPIPIVFSNGQ
jgi:hypothetical protein